jgi:hypothetical protein
LVLDNDPESTAEKGKDYETAEEVQKENVSGEP